MLRRAETCPRRVLGAGTRLGSVQKAGAREQKSEAQARASGVSPGSVARPLSGRKSEPAAQRVRARSAAG